MQQRATPMRAIPSALPVRASGGRSLWASGLFIACVAAVAVVVGGLGWAVYALGRVVPEKTCERRPAWL